MVVISEARRQINADNKSQYGVKVDDKVTFYPALPEWLYRGDDLYVRIHPAPRNFQYKLDGATVIIPQGTMGGRVDFTPGGSIYFNSKIAWMALTKIFKEVQEFLDYHKTLEDNKPGSPPQPTYLYGITNQKMAKFSELLGFKVDQMSNGKKRYVYATPEGLSTQLDSLRQHANRYGNREQKLAARFLK